MRAPAFRFFVIGLAGLRVCAKDALYYLDVEQVVCTSKEIQLYIRTPSDTNSMTPHVPAVYRTSKAQVDVQFSLTDSSGQAIATTSTVALHAHARRLAAEEEDPLCEQVFLADGREPVDLPDTWAEARSSFRGICERDGVAEAEACAAAAAELFSGHPRADEDFRPQGNFCADLARYILGLHGQESLVQQRRLKGGSGSYKSSSGSAAIGGWDSRTRPDMAPYGYTAGRAGAVFPRGYATTSYGYSAVGASAPVGRTGRIFAVASGGLVGFTAWRWASRSGASASKCGTDASQCEWDVADEELVRDDLMHFGFVPKEMQYPLKLRIMSISGADLAPERICTPEDWSNLTSELPLTRRDLFFGIVPVEELEEDADLRFLGLLAIIPLFLCCVACIFRRKLRRCCCPCRG